MALDKGDKNDKDRDDKDRAENDKGRTEGRTEHEQKPAPPFQARTESGTPIGGGVGQVASDWAPDVPASDGSPVKTAVPSVKPGAWKPKTVAEHNAEVNQLALDQASELHGAGARSKY